MTMSDRIAVMNHGRYEQLGRPEELYERPATRFVASFLGASNLLAGTATDTAGSVATVALAGGPEVHLSRTTLGGRTRVEVGVRPEKIHITERDSAADGRNRLEGLIHDVSYAGVSTLYRVEIPGGQLVTVYEQNLARTERGTLWERGDAVSLLWSPDDTFAVDPPAVGADDGSDHGEAPIG